MLNSLGHHEDAFVLAPPPQGMGLVQSVDIISPLGNDPYLYGKTAAANALSDIYAMGGDAYSAMNILSFPSCDIPIEVVQEILRGAAHSLEEADAVNAGGHTLEDAELRFGLSVTGIVDVNHFSRNSGLETGHMLILTKPLGVGVLSTGIKANWENSTEAEQEMYTYTTKLNKNAARVIRDMKLRAATDVTGFGLGGHALEMAFASQKTIILYAQSIPLMKYAREYAENGLIPETSYVNMRFSEPYFEVKPRTNVDERNTDDSIIPLIFDPQSSGGLLMAVPKNRVKEAQIRLEESGEDAFIIGEVSSLQAKHLVII